MNSSKSSNFCALNLVSNALPTVKTKSTIFTLGNNFLQFFQPNHSLCCMIFRLDKMNCARLKLKSPEFEGENVVFTLFKLERKKS